MRRIVLTKADIHSGYLVLINAKFGYQEPLEGKRERLLPVGEENGRLRICGAVSQG